MSYDLTALDTAGISLYGQGKADQQTVDQVTIDQQAQVIADDVRVIAGLRTQLADAQIQHVADEALIDELKARIAELEGELDPPDPRFTGTPGQPLWGESTDGGCPNEISPPHDWSGIEALMGGEHIGCGRSYWQAGQDDLMVTQATKDLANGTLPLLSTKTIARWNTPETFTQLDALLAKLDAVGGPVALAVHHEPYDDTDGFPGGANMGSRDDHVAMSRHVMDNCPDNVTYYVNVQGFPFNPTMLPPGTPANILPWFRDAAGPVCHVATMNGYNGWYLGGHIKWHTASQVFEPVLAAMATLGIPLGVCEWGCRYDPAHPTARAQYIADAFEIAVSFNLAWMSYFNSYLNSPNGDWYLTDTHATPRGDRSGESAWIAAALDPRAGHLEA